MLQGEGVLPKNVSGTVKYAGSEYGATENNYEALRLFNEHPEVLQNIQGMGAIQEEVKEEKPKKEKKEV